MNISKFNQELGNKLAKAKNLEKFNDLKEAIKIWLDISEMTLQASKDPKIDNHFRNMLIRKTQEIIEHVRELKEKYQPTPIQKSRENIPEISDFPETIQDSDSDGERDEIDQVIDKISRGSNQEMQKMKKIENADYKNLPKGFIPIEPSQSFKPITPYNEKAVQQRIEDADKMDMSIFTKNEKKSEIDAKKKVIICFACGEENPINAQICTHCGTKL